MKRASLILVSNSVRHCLRTLNDFDNCVEFEEVVQSIMCSLIALKVEEPKLKCSLTRVLKCLEVIPMYEISASHGHTNLYTTFEHNERGTRDFS